MQHTFQRVGGIRATDVVLIAVKASGVFLVFGGWFAVAGLFGGQKLTPFVILLGLIAGYWVFTPLYRQHSKIALGIDGNILQFGDAGTKQAKTLLMEDISAITIFRQGAQFYLRHAKGRQFEVRIEMEDLGLQDHEFETVIIGAFAEEGIRLVRDPSYVELGDKLSLTRRLPYMGYRLVPA